MSSALRLGLRPAAAASNPLLRPHPAAATHLAAPTPPTTRAFSLTPAALRFGFKTDRRTDLKVGLPFQGTPRDQGKGAPPLPIPKPHARDAHIPPYPYGPRTVYKQSNSGLYGLGRIRFGNNVSEKHNVKTHRIWRPNVTRKSLWSFALGCWVQTRLTLRVLRTIDKVGGLDEYLLGDQPRRIKELGPWGWKLRWRIMQSPLIRKRFDDERIELGLAPRLEADFQRALKMEQQSVVAMKGVRGSSVGADALPQGTMVAETDSLIASGVDIPLGIEGSDLEPVVENGESPTKEDKPVVDESLVSGPEVSKDDFPVKEDLVPGPELAKDEGSMKKFKKVKKVKP